MKAKLDYSHFLSQRARLDDVSVIRELLKASSTPGVISMAGGMPAAQSFPTEWIKNNCARIISRYANEVFQYGTTEGDMYLREAISEYVKQRKIAISSRDIYISAGAQSAIDAVSKALLDAEDTVITESPTFLAALKTLKMQYPRIIGIKAGADGMDLNQLEEVLKTNKVKFIYLIPNFQNPTGATMSEHKRYKVAEMLEKYNTLLVEDDPYYELRYTGAHLLPIKAIIPERVIYIGSLSKVFSPGMRLGYYVAPISIAERMTSIRQGTDVHANRLAQAIAAEYIRSGEIYDQTKKTISLYSEKLDYLIKNIEISLPKEVYLNKPQGGMFVWLQLLNGVSDQEFTKLAMKEKVAAVPGTSFFPKQDVNNFIRLNFTNASLNDIETAVLRFKHVFKLLRMRDNI